MAQVQDSALLLRRIPYGDSSLICHLLTREHGRVALMARGARRARSGLRASLQPLHHLHVSWKSGRTGMGTLTEAQRLQPLLDESRALEGLELLALAFRLYHEGDQDGYRETLLGLDFLSRRPAPEGWLGAVWLLLEHAGWIGDLGHCWRCGCSVPAEAEMFWQGGHLCCRSCGGASIVQPGLRRSMAGVLATPTVRLSARDARDWEQMIALVMREHGVRFAPSISSQPDFNRAAQG